MRTPVHRELGDCSAGTHVRRPAARSLLRRGVGSDAARSSAGRHPGRVLLAFTTLALGIGSCQLPQPPIPRLLVRAPDGAAANPGAAADSTADAGAGAATNPGTATDTGATDAGAVHAAERPAVQASRRGG